MFGRRELVKQGAAAIAAGVLAEAPLTSEHRPSLFGGLMLQGDPVLTTENLIRRPSISSDAAARAVAAAVAESNKTSVPVTIVIVDESGVLKEIRRMDGAPLVSVQTAINKAYAAAAIGMPTDDFYTAIQADAAAVASFASRPGLALIAGGVPLQIDGMVAGGIGVAGALTGAEDKRIAEQGARIAFA